MSAITADIDCEPGSESEKSLLPNKLKYYELALDIFIVLDHDDIFISPSFFTSF